MPKNLRFSIAASKGLPQAGCFKIVPAKPRAFFLNGYKEEMGKDKRIGNFSLFHQNELFLRNKIVCLELAQINAAGKTQASIIRPVPCDIVNAGRR